MARPGRRPGDQSAGEATKAKLVQAALDSLHEDGILGASARAIAKRGDFNQALIFYHFGSVTDLLLAAVDELSSRRSTRYSAQLAEVGSLSELVAVAGELHAEDMRDGHITVLTQMLAAAATDATLREPLRQRFEPWIETVEQSVVRALGDSPYGQLVPARDLAFAITSLFVGLELLLNLEPDDGGEERRVFATFTMLAAVLENILGALPAPPVAAAQDKPETRPRGRGRGMSL